MKYHFTTSHIPGKDLVIADSLSQAPIVDQRPEDIQLEENTNTFVYQVQKHASKR